jgi:hypothetical protein
LVHLRQPAGELANFGWPCMEGDVATPLEGVEDPASPWHQCQAVRAADPQGPVHHYPHTSEGGSITAGVVLDGPAYPEAVWGHLLYGDYAQDQLTTVSIPHGAESVAGQVIADAGAAGGPVKIFPGPDGWVWTVSIFGGAVQRLTYADDPASDACAIGELERAFHDLDGAGTPFDVANAVGGAEWRAAYERAVLPEAVLSATECVDEVELAPTTGSPWATEAEPDRREHPGDRFGVSWRGRVELDGGTYRFHLRGSEWVRLSVDGVTVHDSLADEGGHHDLVLTSGVHTLSVEALHGDADEAHAAVTWDRLGLPPVVSLLAPVNGVVTDGTLPWAVSVSDPDGDATADLVASTRVVAHFLHYRGGTPHLHPYHQVEGQQKGTMSVDDVHAPGQGVVRLIAVTTDASGARTRSAPVYVCFPYGDVGPCAD